MPRPNRTTYTPADANLTGFASNVTGAAFTITTTATSDGLAHQVSIRNDSSTDHSGKTVTLVGTDADGKALTEIVTGPGNGATVESAGYFKTLTSATPSATIGSDTFDIGWVDEFVTPTFPLNPYSDDVAVAVEVTGTINYTLQHTFNQVQTDTAAFTWFDHDDADLVSATANKNSNYTVIPMASRVKINSYTNGATITFTVIHSC